MRLLERPFSPLQRRPVHRPRHLLGPGLLAAGAAFSARHAARTATRVATGERLAWQQAASHPVSDLNSYHTVYLYKDMFYLVLNLAIVCLCFIYMDIYYQIESIWNLCIPIYTSVLYVESDS